MALGRSEKSQREKLSHILNSSYQPLTFKTLSLEMLPTIVFYKNGQNQQSTPCYAVTKDKSQTWCKTHHNLKFYACPQINSYLPTNMGEGEMAKFDNRNNYFAIHEASQKKTEQMISQSSVLTLQEGSTDGWRLLSHPRPYNIYLLILDKH